MEKITRFILMQGISDEDIERLEVQKLEEALNKKIPYPQQGK